MGCGMSKTNLVDEAFGKRKAAPKLLIKDKPQSIVDKPPELQKINTTGTTAHNNNINSNGGGRNSNVDFGSPSFREYITCSPLSTTTDNQQGEKETVNGKQGARKFTCNHEVCGWEHSTEDTEQAHKKETKVGRFRKVFQVHKVTFWHGRPWQIGHPKATKKTA